MQNTDIIIICFPFGYVSEIREKVINKSGRKLDSRILGNGWVGVNEQSKSEWSGGKSDRVMIDAEQAIRKKVIGEWVIGEQINMGASDQGVIEKKKTVRNKWKYFLFETLSACHENM